MIKAMYLPQTKYEQVKRKEGATGERMGFKLAKFGYSCEIYMPDSSSASQQTENLWRSQLSGSCVNNCFHELFSVKKLIGKGSFGRVYSS